MNLCQGNLVLSTELEHNPIKGGQHKGVHVHVQKPLGIVHDALFRERYPQYYLFPPSTILPRRLKKIPLETKCPEAELPSPCRANPDVAAMTMVKLGN